MSQGQFAIVDAASFDWLNQWNWTAVWDDQTQSYYATRGITRPSGKQKTILMHRLIAGDPDGKIVDHKDHDTLNNRRKNLRAVSDAESNWNRRIRKDSTSGATGVTWNSRDRLWYARLGVNGKRLHLGNFKTKEEAISAYSTAAIEHHGAFADLNDRVA